MGALEKSVHEKVYGRSGKSVHEKVYGRSGKICS